MVFESSQKKHCQSRTPLANFSGAAHVCAVTIHNQCPCRIEISPPRGQNFNQGRGLHSLWLNSDPEGQISLSYIDSLMKNCFSPTFSEVFCRNIKSKKKVKILTFTSWIYIISEFMSVFNRD